MTKFEETKSWLAQAAGLREPSTLDRLQQVDWRAYAPTREQVDALYRPYTNQIDATNLIAGVLVGVGVGIALGYAFKGNVAPAVGRVRDRAREAAKSLEESLPEILRVIWVDEAPVRR
jgi:hypothetical protein